MVFPSSFGAEWIEIENDSSVPVSLDAVVLANSHGDRFTIRRGIVIPPGSFVLLANKNDPALAGILDFVYPSTFILRNAGDTLTLISGTDDVVLDSFTYGAAEVQQGKSIALTPDQQGHCVTFQPTPRGPNVCVGP